MENILIMSGESCLCIFVFVFDVVVHRYVSGMKKYPKKTFVAVYLIQLSRFTLYIMNYG